MKISNCENMCPIPPASLELIRITRLLGRTITAGVVAGACIARGVNCAFEDGWRPAAASICLSTIIGVVGGWKELSQRTINPQFPARWVNPERKAASVSRAVTLTYAIAAYSLILEHGKPAGQSLNEFAYTYTITAFQVCIASVGAHYLVYSMATFVESLMSVQKCVLLTDQIARRIDSDVDMCDQRVRSLVNRLQSR